MHESLMAQAAQDLKRVYMGPLRLKMISALLHLMELCFGRLMRKKYFRRASNTFKVDLSAGKPFIKTPDGLRCRGVINTVA